MLKRHTTVFLMLLFIGLVSLVYSSRVLADLTTYYPSSGKAFETELILQPTSSEAMTNAEIELKLLDSQEIVRHRLTRLGVQPHQVEIQDGQLIVSLPDSEHTPYIKYIITQIGYVEFINGGTVAPPIGRTIETDFEAKLNSNTYQTLFTGQEVEEIVPPDLSTGQIFYQLMLQPAAAVRLDDFLTNKTENYVCIVVDKEVISCSQMYHWAENTLQILPNLSSGSMIGLTDLALFLESGRLPLSMRAELP